MTTHPANLDADAALAEAQERSRERSSVTVGGSSGDVPTSIVRRALVRVEATRRVTCPAATASAATSPRGITVSCH